MIAAFIAKLALRAGLPHWAVQAIFSLLLGIVVFGGLAFVHHHIYHQGELAADARNATVNKANSDRADAEQIRLNARIAAAQSNLDMARADLEKLSKELQDEQAVSTDRQRRLLAGDLRLRVLTRQRPADPNGQAPGGPATDLDQGTEVVVDLASGPAAAIDQLRTEHNEAVRRLEGCILEFDAVKAAADAMP